MEAAPTVWDALNAENNFPKEINKGFFLSSSSKYRCMLSPFIVFKDFKIEKMYAPPL